jgi:hypothetical protein
LELFIERNAHGAGWGEGAAAGAAVCGHVDCFSAVASAVGVVEDPVVVCATRGVAVC